MPAQPAEAVNSDQVVVLDTNPADTWLVHTRFEGNDITGPDYITGQILAVDGGRSVQQ